MENEKDIQKNSFVDDKKKKINIKNLILYIIQGIIILICITGAIFVLVNRSKVTYDDPGKIRTSMMLIQTDSMEPTIKTHDIIFSSKFDGNHILDIGTVVTYPVKSGDSYITITHRIVGYYYQNLESETGIKIYGNENVKSFSDIENKNGAKNVKFIGYLTRGDKYTFENGASLEDYAIYYSDNTINYNKDDYYYSYLTNDLILSTWSGRKSTFLGNIVYFLSNANHIMIVLVIPIILLILYNMFLIIREIVGDKKKLAKDNALKQMMEEQKKNEEEIKKQAIEEYLASLKSQ